MQLLRSPPGETGRAPRSVRGAARLCRAVAVVLAIVATGACATGPTGSVLNGPGRSTRTRTKLAVLPIEADAHFGKLATALNEQLRDVKVAGVDDYFVSKVTLEVIQLSIECVDQTVECYAAVGKSLAANHLLFGTIVGGTRKRDKSVKIVLSLFDVASASFTRTVERQFKSLDEAMRGASELVAQLSVSGGGPAHTARAVESGR